MKITDTGRLGGLYRDKLALFTLGVGTLGVYWWYRRSKRVEIEYFIECVSVEQVTEMGPEPSVIVRGDGYGEWVATSTPVAVEQ